MTAKSPIPPHWNIVSLHRRWGCLTTAIILAAVGAAGLGLLIWLVRPRPAVHPLNLIGNDVDGLAIIELSRASSRIAHFVETIIRPMSYEVQSRPEDLGHEISQLLDVMTYRRAIGLLRYDPTKAREQWAWVVPLKRMGDPLKALVREIASREAARGIELETSGGVLVVCGKAETPCVAVGRKAAVVAGDRAWLNNVLARIEHPTARTPRANRLYYGLPSGGKHCMARACILASPQRWQGWSSSKNDAPAYHQGIAQIRRLVEKGGVRSGDVELLALTATVQPRQQIRFDLAVSCRDTTASALLARALDSQWKDVQRTLKELDLNSLDKPTRAGAGILVGWTTLRIEEMLGLSPADFPTAGKSSSNQSRH